MKRALEVSWLAFDFAPLDRVCFDPAPMALSRPLFNFRFKWSTTMTLGTILLIVLVLLLLGALPTWPHSRSWGYYPSGGLGLVVIILLLLLVTGRI